MITLFAALELEVRGLVRRMERVEHRRVDGFPVAVGSLAGSPALLCRTGMGPRAGEAAASVLSRYRPSAVLSLGMGGALSPQLRRGDLVLCTQTHLAGKPAEGPRGALPSDRALLAAAQRAAVEAGIPFQVGDALTVAQVVARPAEKAALRSSTTLDVVEMEGYWVAAVAHRLGLPFLAVRSISDIAVDPLPELPGLITPEGEMRVGRALLCVLRRPSLLPGLARMAIGSRRAVANLGLFSKAFARVLAAQQGAVTERLADREAV